MRRFLISLILTLPLWSRDPKIWLDGQALDALRARAAARDTTWRNLKQQCDSVYLPATVYRALDTDLRPSFGTGAYNRVYSTAAITVGYQGSAAASATSLGYYDAILNLGLCYQALKLSDPSAAGRYARKGAEVLRAMSVEPGILTLGDGSTRVIGDTTWAAGTAWPASGVAVDEDLKGGSTRFKIPLRGLTPGGTILSNDAFLIDKHIYVVQVATRADADGRATVTVAPAVSDQYMPVIQNAGPVTANYADGAPVTQPLIVYSLKSNVPNGATVTISGVTGNTAVNGTWKVSWLTTSDRLILTGSSAVGVSAPQTNLAWQPMVNTGYGARFYGVALAHGYDWFYDALTEEDRLLVASELARWYSEVKRVNYGAYGMMHPSGNYFAGAWRFLVSVAAALDTDDPTTSRAAWSDFYDTFYAGAGGAIGGGRDSDWVQRYFAKHIQDAFHPDGANYGWFATENMLGAVLAANTYKQLNLFREPEPGFQWPDGLARSILYHSWPNRDHDKDIPYFDSRGVTFASNSGIAGNVMGATAPLMLSYILRRYEFPFARNYQYFLKEMVTVWDKAPPNIQPAPYGDRRAYALKFLFYDEDAPQEDYKTLPLSFFGKGWSEMAMRSDWTESAVWANFNAGPWIEGVEANKLIGDSGNLAIVRGRARFLVNGPNELAWGGLDGTPYYLSPANAPMPAPHNIFFADHPGTFKNQYGFGPGQKARSAYPCVYANGSGISQQVEQGPVVYMRATRLEENYPAFGANSGNPCGSPRSVIHWTRDVFFVRPKLFFVRDWTTVPDGGRRQFMMWHFGKTPAAADAPTGMFRFNVADDHLFKGALLTAAPAQHTVELNSSIPTGYGTAQVARAGATVLYRVEVSPAPNTTSNAWLTILDAADRAERVYTYAKLESSSADVIQIMETNIVAAFPTDEAFSGTLGYKFRKPPKGAAKIQHYVTGLTPLTRYLVTISGAPSTLTSDKGGVLQFTTPGQEGEVEVRSVETLGIQSAIDAVTSQGLGIPLVGAGLAALLASATLLLVRRRSRRTRPA